MPTDRPHPVPPPPAWQPPPPAPWPAAATPRPVPAHSTGLGAPLIAALVAAAAGFVELSFWSSRTENGLVVECSYTNLAPWIFGPVAVVCGLVALVRRAGSDAAAPPPPARRPLALMAIGVGALHLVTAFGALDLLSRNPC